MMILIYAVAGAFVRQMTLRMLPSLRNQSMNQEASGPCVLWVTFSAWTMLLVWQQKMCGIKEFWWKAASTSCHPSQLRMDSSHL